MKIKTTCPHCEISQRYRSDEVGANSEVRCKMDWCLQPFDSSKKPQKMVANPDHEVLKRA